jgi:hypothetical protein
MRQPIDERRPRTTRTSFGKGSAAPRTQWLNAEEQAAWRAVATLMSRLPWALECQLQRDARLSFTEYHALARLSEDPSTGCA